jgi:hypothetical protein
MKKRTFVLLLAIAILYSLFSIRDSREPDHLFKSTFLSFSEALPLNALPISRNDLLPFAGGNQFGYIDTHEKRIYAERFAERVALDENGWLVYNTTADNLQYYLRHGGSFQIHAYAYPWFKESWRILIRVDQMGVARCDEKGTILWEIETSMPITALDASREILTLGLLDGSLKILDLNGKQLKADGGMREQKQIIYGIAISQDRQYIAMIQGNAPQKIEIFQRSENSYFNIDSRQLENSSVFQTSMSFSKDGSHLIAARDNQVIYYNRKGKFCALLSISPPLKEAAKAETDFQYQVICAINNDTIAVLRTLNYDIKDTCILLLRNGKIWREAPSALNIVGGDHSFALIYADGVELMEDN